VEEIRQQLLAGQGEDALGVELYALNGELAVADRHDGVVGGAGGDLEAFGHRGRINDQRVVAGGGEGLGQAAEDGLAVVLDHAGLAVHQHLGADDAGAKGLTDALMAEADAEDGDAAGEVLDGRHADAGFERGAGTRRNDQSRGLQGFDPGQGHLIVAADLDGLSQLAEVLGEVVGERVVVVEEEDHGNQRPARAISRARIMAPALLTHSMYSLSGTESATTPAPTWI